VSDGLTRSIALDCSVEHTFDVFTRLVDLWWPRGHRRHRDGSLRLEARPGGALIDRAADGSEWTMARVREIDPPTRLALDWFPGSPDAPTAVDIRFAAEGGGTLVTITHRPLTGSAAIWPQRVATFASGWDAVLAALKVQLEQS
jgi:uncharacterized protein YndB with AHSA1/START domain